VGATSDSDVDSILIGTSETGIRLLSKAVPYMIMSQVTGISSLQTTTSMFVEPRNVLMLLLLLLRKRLILQPARDLISSIMAFLESFNNP
jgi:hypothetical protein